MKEFTKNSNSVPTLILTAGLPGAGKSTYLRNAGIELPKVDPDEAKKLHPDYDPKNPQAVHNWSKKVARRFHLSLLSKNVDFVVDGTGTNVEKYARYIKEAQELGYKVELHYVRVKLETSIKRNANRARVVPMSVILEKADVIEQTTSIIAKMCDDFVVVEND